VLAWRDRLIAIDTQWVRPLLDALRAITIADITIVACNRENLLESTVTRSGLRKFWRRARMLSTYAGNP
jgi:hypothetical protein